MPETSSLQFIVKSALYPLQAVYAASYIFIDKTYVRLDLDAAGDYVVQFKAKQPGAPLENLAGEFHNELLHQALRQKISESNQKIREYIVTQALLSAQPAEDVEAAKAQAEQAPVLDEALEKEIEELLAQVEKESEGRDPLGKSVPWDEGSKRQPPAPAAQELEKEVEKLLDHAEQESKAAQPEGSPMDVKPLAAKVGRREPKKGARKGK